jgi:hypothetical protein
MNANFVKGQLKVGNEKAAPLSCISAKKTKDGIELRCFEGDAILASIQVNRADGLRLARMILTATTDDSHEWMFLDQDTLKWVHKSIGELNRNI